MSWFDVELEKSSNDGTWIEKATSTKQNTSCTFHVDSVTIDYIWMKENKANAPNPEM